MMIQYTIFCTEEQTRKALEFGAPIEVSPMIDILRDKIGKYFFLSGSNMYWFPTAEQMCGWLRTIDIAVYAFVDNNEKEFTGWSYEVVKDFTHGGWKNTIAVPDKCFNTYEEAILAAIDAALEYLSKTRNNNGNS